MNDKPAKTWTERWDAFLRRHPFLLFAYVVLAAFLAGPLMVAASHATAVLYKDF